MIKINIQITNKNGQYEATIPELSIISYGSSLSSVFQAIQNNIYKLQQYLNDTNQLDAQELQLKQYINKFIYYDDLKYINNHIQFI